MEVSDGQDGRHRPPGRVTIGSARTVWETDDKEQLDAILLDGKRPFMMLTLLMSFLGPGGRYRRRGVDRLHGECRFALGESRDGRVFHPAPESQDRRREPNGIFTKPALIRTCSTSRCTAWRCSTGGMNGSTGFMAVADAPVKALLLFVSVPPDNPDPARDAAAFAPLTPP
jgi:hypothetical protein